MITRRGFFAALAAAFVADPERLLWVPGQKKIFLTPVRVHAPLLDEINAITLKHLNKTVIEDLFYAAYPFRGAGNYISSLVSGGDYISEPLLYR